MDKIHSADGTPIAYQCSGTGPPLVLVHGTLGSSRRWPILPILERRFTVYAMDRRGRGESGDATSYTIAREFEDVAAVVNSIGEKVHLLGHSFGGLCALEATLLTSHVRSLVLYEPAPAPAPAEFGRTIDQLQSLLDNGNREGMVIRFLRDVVEMPQHEIDVLKASPVFPAMVAAAHTLPRELRAEVAYRLDPRRFEQLKMPVLLLMGSDSPPGLKSTAEMFHGILPMSRIVVLPGQQHVAHYTAPDMFARELQAFLLGVAV